MAEQKQKAQYAKPASQVDLEERLENDNKSFKVLSTSDQYEAPEAEEGRTYAVEGNKLDGYVGVSGEYATYANDTEAPVKADESAESKVIESFNEQITQLETEGRIGDDPAKDEEEDEAPVESDSKTSASTAGSTTTQK